MEQLKRDTTLDIAKAVCIILMVIGHAGCPKYMCDVVYLFHMPCFFFISGLLFNEKYYANLSSGIKKKLRSYYVPFVKWELLFLLFHNAFATLHIYDSNFTLSQFVECFVRIVTMTGGERLLGGFWFLISMTWASVIAVFFCHILNEYSKLTNFSISVGVIFLLIIAFIQAYLPFNILSQFGPQTFLAAAFFMTGYLCKRTNIMQKGIMRWKIVFILLPLVTVPFFVLKMTDAKGYEVFIYYIIAICGSLGVIGISTFVSKTKGSKFLIYIGNKTLYILIFHFLAFKGVSYLYIIMNNLPITDLSPFPVLKNAPSYLWIIYTVVGIAFSVIVWEIVDRTQKKLAKESK